MAKNINQKETDTLLVFSFSRSNGLSENQKWNNNNRQQLSICKFYQRRHAGYFASAVE